MSINNTTYPAFDFLEFQPELELKYKPYKKLEPVTSGAILTNLLQISLTQPKIISDAQRQSFAQSSAQPYFNKIQVVYFYSSAWKQTSLEHLKQLHAIRHEIRYNDGELLIVNADPDPSVLHQLLWEHNLLLTPYHDPSNEIGQIFGVFAEESPAWNYYAGIDVNVPVPAVFVLDHFLRVIFDEPNTHIEPQLPLHHLIDAVYQGNHQHSRKSA